MSCVEQMIRPPTANVRPRFQALPKDFGLSDCDPLADFGNRRLLLFRSAAGPHRPRPR